eukprot:9679080-Alexandrium_andersonii.AAC.1
MTSTPPLPARSSSTSMCLNCSRGRLWRPLQLGEAPRGIAYDWLGYWVGYSTFKFGISVRRSAWII